MGTLKARVGAAWIPVASQGIGIPTGGGVGSVLIKNSPVDYDTTWAVSQDEVFIGTVDPIVANPGAQLWYDTSGTFGILKARVGAAWVPAGGADEVFVGPADPIATSPQIELWYDDDAPSYAPVSSASLGQVALAETAAGYNGIVGEFDYPGLSVTFITVAGRRYKAECTMLFFAPVAATANMGIYDHPSNARRTQGAITMSANGYGTITSVLAFTGVGGALTLKVRTSATAGVNAVAAATLPIQLLVTDLGSP